MKKVTMVHLAGSAGRHQRPAWSFDVQEQGERQFCAWSPNLWWNQQRVSASDGDEEGVGEWRDGRWLFRENDRANFCTSFSRQDTSVRKLSTSAARGLAEGTFTAAMEGEATSMILRPTGQWTWPLEWKREPCTHFEEVAGGKVPEQRRHQHPGDLPTTAASCELAELVCSHQVPRL